MTTLARYDELVRAVAALGHTRSIEQARIRAKREADVAEAHDIPRKAAKESDAAKTRVHRQHEAGRASLGSIEQESLLPARVRPGKAAGGVTKDGLDRLVRGHAAAVDRLAAAVAAYEQAMRADAIRRQTAAQEAAEAASRRRRQEQEAERRRLEEERRRAEEERRRQADAAAKARQQQQAIVAAIVVAVALVLVLLVVAVS